MCLTLLALLERGEEVTSAQVPDQVIFKVEFEESFRVSDEFAQSRDAREQTELSLRAVHVDAVVGQVQLVNVRAWLRWRRRLLLLLLACSMQTE